MGQKNYPSFIQSRNQHNRTFIFSALGRGNRAMWAPLLVVVGFHSPDGAPLLQDAGKPAPTFESLVVVRHRRHG